MKKDRLQINIRVDDLDLQMIEVLRRSQSPIPTATDIWRDALRQMYDRHISSEKKSRK